MSTDANGGTTTTTTNASGNNSSLDLNETQKHQLRHRELFLTRQNETLLATNIRGKCSVTLYNETESYLSYVNTEVGSVTWFSLKFYFEKFLGSILLSIGL